VIAAERIVGAVAGARERRWRYGARIESTTCARYQRQRRTNGAQVVDSILAPYRHLREGFDDQPYGRSRNVRWTFSFQHALEPFAHGVALEGREVARVGVFAQRVARGRSVGDLHARQRCELRLLRGELVRLAPVAVGHDQRLYGARAI
jgi:hypothetical protein